ncbi:hypothetical protein N9Y81_03065 [Akkermansiaceae bacterium]|jgi:hypothetical protein|nr:hypothetical protein [Akkermansiaceae bacterium]
MKFQSWFSNEIEKTDGMTRHQWRGEDGEEIRFWRANYHGGRFELYTKTDDDDRWEKLDPPSKEVWEALRDVLWRKYQRKRCAWNLIAKVDKILGKPNEGPGE